MVIFNGFRFFIEYRMELKISKSGQQASFASKTYIYIIRIIKTNCQIVHHNLQYVGHN